MDSTHSHDRPPPDHPTTSSLDTITLPETTTTTTNAVVSSGYANTNTNSNTSFLPFILAPILAVFGFGGLFFLWRHFYKRKRAKQVAPSAEFQKYRCRSIPLADAEAGCAAEAAAAEGTSPMDGRHAMYAQPGDRGKTLEGGNTGLPPLFPPGLFKDPIFEKGVAISLGNQSSGHEMLLDKHIGRR